MSTEDSFVTLCLSQGNDDPIQPWYMSPTLSGIYTGLSLESTVNGQFLRWQDRTFENGNARFCQKGSKIRVVFWGSPGIDCEFVDLVAFRLR